ncbi:MAG: Eco57I restriction-modification methylase domain-containing protein, partial [Terracidiphilus sp.]
RGVVYTKRWVVELLLDLAGYTSSANLVDALAIEPAAGDGAFLCMMIERLADSCRRLNRPITDCRDSLIAYELDHVSAECTRFRAAQVLKDHGVVPLAADSLVRGWVHTGDYLCDSVGIEADFVIGNPPYVRLEDIPDETARHYRRVYSTMCGRADLYVAFFEGALRQLKDGGICAFICADRWMRNQYGVELRELITSGFSVDVVIEMHNAEAFHDEVDAYPAITVIRRGRQGSAVVASAGPEVADVPSLMLAASLLKNSANKGHERSHLPVGLRAAHVSGWFKGGDPWPCDTPRQLALLRRLEDSFAPLETNAKVGIGVATGNDRIFITTDAGLVEPERLLKLAMAKDISGGVMKWSGHYLVDPWSGGGLVKLEHYPRLHSYFVENEAALKKRHTAINNAYGWYKTIDRVTHALAEKPKLYIADIKNTLDPVLDRGETYPHHNLYFIQSENWDLEVLGGLLISAVGQFFIESYGVRMRGGYLRFQAQYLRRIRVPDPKKLSKANALKLATAFRARDRQLATQIALEVYGIDEREMELAIGH